MLSLYNETNTLNTNYFNVLLYLRTECWNDVIWENLKI